MHQCDLKPCFELKHKGHLYLMKSQLLQYLRDEHHRYWERYDQLYSSGGYIRPSKETKEGWDYSNAAKEILTRCRMYDNLYNNVLNIDLMSVKDFGNYCKTVFIEINKLKPAFPASSVSVSCFDQTIRELRKFVMKQSHFDESGRELEPVGVGK